MHGGRKFVALKCGRATRPGDDIIRSQIWEKDDRASCNNFARIVSSFSLKALSRERGAK